MSEITNQKWFVVYDETEGNYWWSKILRRGFRHVWMCRPVFYGPKITDCLWLVVNPGTEGVASGIHMTQLPPWQKQGKNPTVQLAVARYVTGCVRSWFFVGPVTCVEHVKAHLGVSAWWLRTPRQLYRFIKKNNYSVGN